MSHTHTHRQTHGGREWCFAATSFNYLTFASLPDLHLRIQFKASNIEHRETTAKRALISSALAVGLFLFLWLAVSKLQPLSTDQQQFYDILSQVCLACIICSQLATTTTTTTTKRFEIELGALFYRPTLNRNGLLLLLLFSFFSLSLALIITIEILQIQQQSLDGQVYSKVSHQTALLVICMRV